MKNRHIFAYTAPGAQIPEFISINRKDDRIEITVRSRGSNETALMVLPQDKLNELIYALRGARINPLVAGSLTVTRNEQGGTQSHRQEGKETSSD